MKTLFKIFLILFPFIGFAQLGTGLYGKVGINVGTTTPTERLKVNGTSNFTGLAILSGGITATGTVSLPSTTSIGSVTSTDISRISGLTDNAQTQINLKAPINNPTFTGTVQIGSILNVESDINIAKAQAAQAIANTSGIVSGQNFKNNWNASTNSPTLTTTPSTSGDYYIVSVAGTQSITGSSTSFAVGDRIISNGTAWVKTAFVNYIPDKSIYPKKTIFIRKGKNLFDKTTATLDKFLGADNTEGSSTTYAYSDYIEVSPSTTYVSNFGMRFTTYYNVSGTYVSGGSSSTITSFTTPSNVYYVRVTFDKVNLNAFQFEQGSSSTIYENFTYKLDSNFVKLDNITTSKIVNSAITPQKTNFLKQGKNLFDKTKATLNFFLGENNVATANTSFGYSDYIPVLPSTTYYGASPTGMRFTTYYDAGQNFVSGGSSSTITSFTTPSNVYYVRVTFTKSEINNFQFEQGSSATFYEKYTHKIDSNYVSFDKFLTANYADSSVTDIKLKSTFVKSYKTKNLFDKTTATLDKFLGNDNTIGSSTTFAYSDFISVLPSTTYTGRSSSQPMRFTTYYDINKSFVSGGSNAEISTFTTPSNVRYVRVTLYKSEIETFQFEQGSSQTSYTKPFAIADNIKVTTANESAQKDKIWSGIGDSVTEQAKWQPTVKTRLGILTYYNYGRAGTRVTGLDTNAICSQRRIDQINSSSEIITFMGGTNDWANNVALGTMSDTSSLVFYGAVKNLIKRLTVKFPTKLIVGISTPFAKYPNKSGWSDTYGLKNNLGLTTLDYAKVVEDVCKSMGILYIDIYGKSGINDYNYLTYFTDDGAFLHPNTTGGVRIGNIVANDLYYFNF